MNPKTVARRSAIKALAMLEDGDKPLGAILDDLRLAADARPFAREIASGTVRHRARVDWTLRPLLSKPLHKLDAPVRAALRLAAYERCALGTPARAVADEYAEAMRAARMVSAVAFVNAVARRLPDAWPASPDRARDPLAFLAHEYSYPDWLVKRWLARLGFDECEALCQAGNVIAPLSLRANTRRATRDEIIAALQSRGLAARPGTVSSDAVVVERSGERIGSPNYWPEWVSGQIIAQDEAAQLVSRFAFSCLCAAQAAKQNDNRQNASVQKHVEQAQTANAQAEHAQTANAQAEQAQAEQAQAEQAQAEQAQAEQAQAEEARRQSAEIENEPDADRLARRAGFLVRQLTIIDACAAPGGKTTHLAQLSDDCALIIACDLAPGRLKLVSQNAARLRLTSTSVRAGDFREMAHRADSNSKTPPLVSHGAQTDAMIDDGGETETDFFASEDDTATSTLPASVQAPREPVQAPREPAQMHGERLKGSSSDSFDDSTPLAKEPGEIESALREALPLADLVLLDAPCLGTGTLRRRPDAKWRKTAAQLAQLIALQRELLDAAALVVKPGGVLAYATCSLEPEENEEQAQAFLARHLTWHLAPPHFEHGVEVQSALDEKQVPPSPQNAARLEPQSTEPQSMEPQSTEFQRFVGDDGYLRTWPHRDGCDGAFAACFVNGGETPGEGS